MTNELPRGVGFDDKGKAKLPPARFKDFREVQETCQAMIDLDRTERATERAKVDGLINGNRPWNPSAMAAKGFGWMPNVNLLEAEGFLQASQTPLFDLVTETDHCVEVSLDIKGSPEEIQRCENSIQTNFTWLMFVRWRRGFNYHILMQQLQMLKHGLGTHIRPTKSWIPRTQRAGMILFPANAPLNFDEDGEYFMVRDYLPAHVLHGFIRNEKAAATLGWKPDAVWKALATSSKTSSQSMEEVQRGIRSGDIGWTQARQAGTWLNYMFYKEIDTGKISQAIVVDSASQDVGNYLFEKRNMYEDWSFLSLFNYDIGDGDINSIRGLGKRTAPFFELSNRLKNAMSAQVLMSMFPMVKQNQPDIDPDKLKLMRLGALGILPYGVEPSLIQFPPLNNGPIALSRELRDTMEGNNQSVVGGSPEPKDRETKYSFMVRSQDSARVSNGLQSLYESNLQQFYDKTLRMVMDTPKGDQPYQVMAEEFRERCRRDGCPEGALKSRALAEVREVTSTGAGSAATRLHALLSLMEYVFPNTTEDKKAVIIRDLVGTLMGGAKVDRYAPSLTDNEMPNTDDSMATVESSLLAQGGDAQVSATQNPVRHASNALAKAMQVMQAVQQGQMQPEQALIALQKLLQHSGEHLSLLQNNRTRKAEFDQLSDQWKQIAQFAQQLQKEIQSQQDQTPPEQQLSEDGQIKMAGLQQDQQRKDTKLAGDEQRKWRTLAFKERIADVSTAAKIQRSRQQTNGARPARAV